MLKNNSAIVVNGGNVGNQSGTAGDGGDSDLKKGTDGDGGDVHKAVEGGVAGTITSNEIVRPKQPGNLGTQGGILGNGGIPNGHPGMRVVNK